VGAAKVQLRRAVKGICSMLRAALAGGMRPLEAAFCGGRQVPGGGMVLRLGRQ
jgi:hypothetical protein